MQLTPEHRTNHTREELAAQLRSGDPPHVARFGDGEILAAMCWQGEPDPVRAPYAGGLARQMSRAFRGNCDGQIYYPDLGCAVARALAYFAGYPHLWLGNWFNWPLGMWVQGFLGENGGHTEWITHDVFTHIEYFGPEATVEVFRAVHESDRRTVLVGPGYLAPLLPWLGASHVVATERNGWDAYRSVLEAARQAVKPQDLVLIAFGMPAKPLMAALLEHEPGAVYWDVGSGLDPLVGRRTRPNQVSQERIRELYQGEMPCNR